MNAIEAVYALRALKLGLKSDLRTKDYASMHRRLDAFSDEEVESAIEHLESTLTIMRNITEGFKTMYISHLSTGYDHKAKQALVASEVVMGKNRFEFVSAFSEAAAQSFCDGLLMAIKQIQAGPFLGPEGNA